MRKHIIVALGLITLVLLSGCGTQAKTSPKKAIPSFFQDCNNQLISNPNQIVLACGDGGTYIESIGWNSWDSNAAVGEGIYYWNNCNPSCAQGTELHTNVKITLTKPILVSADSQAFSQMQVDDLGQTPLPNGKKQEIQTFDIYPVNTASPAANSTSDQSNSNNSVDSSLNPDIVISVEIDQAAGYCVENPCPMNITIANIGNSPQTVYGIIQFQSSSGSWYNDQDRFGNTNTTIDNLTINPGMQKTRYGSQGSYVGAPSGTHFVKVRLYDDATDSGDGVIAESPVNFTVP